MKSLGHRLAATGLVMVAALAVLSAQQPAIEVDRDDITLRGCVTRAGLSIAVPATMLVWGRSDVFLGDVR